MGFHGSRLASYGLTADEATQGKEQGEEIR